ncbi:hypothetical protein HAX54_039563 [Datura stramonium]|uniref:Uncharacterized protein n=1 Tax=Datura stramonium TaxID=4076 RepID=A0ABS8RNG8_DATST|nr:hypothetical protein [Datura stramonium]
MRQNSMNSNANQQDAASFNNSNHSQSSLLQGPNCMLPGQNLPVSGLSSTNLQQQQQRLLSSGLLPQNQSQSSRKLVLQQMIQQLLQDMNTNSGGCGVQQQCPTGQSGGGSAPEEGLAFATVVPMAAATTSHGPGSSADPHRVEATVLNRHPIVNPLHQLATVVSVKSYRFAPPIDVGDTCFNDTAND